MIESFVRDFERMHSGGRIELLSLDTRDGAAAASLYDIISYPAILALQDNGQLLKEWQGEQLPLMNEVAYYATSTAGGIMGSRSARVVVVPAR